jgi:hypothetical protein
MEMPADSMDPEGWMSRGARRGMMRQMFDADMPRPRK